MNRRELLKAATVLSVSPTVAAKTFKLEPSATNGTITNDSAAVIAKQLEMNRTGLWERITALRSAKTLIEHDAAEKAVRDYIYLVVQPILDPRCPDCHRLWRYHAEAEVGTCFNAIRSKNYSDPWAANRQRVAKLGKRKA